MRFTYYFWLICLLNCTVCLEGEADKIFMDWVQGAGGGVMDESMMIRPAPT